MPRIEPDNLYDHTFANGCRLVTYATEETYILGRRAKIGYELYTPSDPTTPLFQGEDFGPSPLHGIDSTEAAMSLLGFLTLKPGDTDQEYFDNYTPEQLEWCKGQEAEELAMIVYEYENPMDEED